MPVSLKSQKIHDLVIHSFTRVLETMTRASCATLGYESFSGKRRRSPKLNPEKDGSDRLFAASVGFAGDLNGVCYLFLSDTLAYQISSEITGTALEKLGIDTVQDVCGELTNMFAGTFKNALADLGLPSSLSVPTVAHGKRIAIKADGTSSHVRYAFDVNGYRMHADLLLAES